jgi:hypothetical protein
MRTATLTGTTSNDGSKKNIGYFLSKTGGFSSHPASPNITPEWWGYNGGSADLNFHFNSNLPQAVKLVIEVAGNANINELGWYDVNNPSVGGVIFPGPAGAGATAVFSPSPNFGLYIKTAGGVKYYTQSNQNPAAETNPSALRTVQRGSWRLLDRRGGQACEHR